VSSNPVSVIVWWTPDCGYLHVETDPLTISVHCPDDVAPDATVQPVGEDGLP